MNNAIKKEPIFKIQHLYAILILCLCYILFNALGSFFSRIDYLIITFLLYIDIVDDDHVLVHGFIFGIFYDLINNYYLGLGVLLFIFLIIFIQKVSVLLELKGHISKIAFMLFVLFLYISFNLYLRHFPLTVFLYNLKNMFFINALFLLFIYSIMEVYNVFVYFKR